MTVIFTARDPSKNFVDFVTLVPSASANCRRSVLLPGGISAITCGKCFFRVGAELDVNVAVVVGDFGEAHPPGHRDELPFAGV